MYEVDGIVYAGDPKLITKVIYAQYQGGHVIRIALNTGEVVDVDFSHGFDGPAFAPLKKENELKRFEIQRGVLTWLDGEVDVAPEYLLDVGKLIEGAVTA